MPECLRNMYSMSATYQLLCELRVCSPIDACNVYELSSIKQSLVLNQACRDEPRTKKEREKEIKKEKDKGGKDEWIKVL